MMKRNDGRFRKILFAVSCIFAMPFLTSFVAYAAVQDTDADGLTDTGELTIYHTDPKNPDTDGDGISDGQEVLNGTNPLDAADHIPLAKDFSNPGILGSPDKFPWYFARAAGILAFILLTASAAFGIVISSRAFLKIVPGADAYEFHRSLSLASLVAVVLHFGSFFFEGFLHLTPVEILVPFAFSRSGMTSITGYDLRIPFTLGVIAFYLIAILVLTAEFRTKMPPKAWRVIHYVSFAAYPLFLLHGFLSGTDSNQIWMRIIYDLSVALMTVLIVIRIFSRTILPTFRRVRDSISNRNAPPEQGPVS
ncbi:MAG: ferric reductase-like transmembrane domain-containing protein [Candidatus Moraniibacteriota bacterium]